VEGAAGVTLCALPASGAEGSLAGCLVMNAMAAVTRLAPMMATPMNVGRGCLAYSAKHPRSHFMAVLVGRSRAGPFPPGCVSCHRRGYCPVRVCGGAVFWVRQRRGGSAWTCQLRYGDPVIWRVAITAIGTVLAGLALPLAFIQLGPCDEDRYRILSA
jgi:hypothetical protein